MRKFALKSMVISAVATMSISTFAATGGGSYHQESVNVDVGDRDSVLRGAVLFAENCMGCHSASMQRYNRIAKDYDLDPEKLKDTVILSPDTKVGDYMISAMPPTDAEQWLGKAPPDLTLMARARSPEYIYNFLRSFYVDPNAATGSNNAMLAGTSMPNVLAKYQTTTLPVYETHMVNGHESKLLVSVAMVKPDDMDKQVFGKVQSRYDRITRDLTNFMVYLAEPVQQQRQRVGFWAILYLTILAGVMYLLKKSYWKHIH